MSHFLLLGTGACEGIPAPFCPCALCSYARIHGGKDVRKRFSVLVNNETLIDFGPDAAQSFRQHGVDDRAIRRILVTHSHVDHFVPTDLLWRNAYPEQNILTLYSNKEVRAAFLSAATANRIPAEKTAILWRENEPGLEVSDNGWHILPIQATHGDAMECAYNYLLTAPDGHKLLVLSDTGWWQPASWSRAAGVMADAAIIEMSFGIHDPYADERQTHLGARSALAFLEKLKSQNSLKPDAICVTTHISHCSNTRHAELETWFSGTPLQPGWDGFRAEF